MQSIENKYFTVQGWMVSKLKLSGCDRDVYAIINGFCLDCESDFHGSIQYLSEMTGYSKRACSESLKYLVDNELVIKYWCPGARSATYKINHSKINFIPENNSGNHEISSGNHEVTSGTPANTSCNNIDINNINNSNNTSSVISLENNYIKEKNLLAATGEVVDYLNSTCGTSFRKTTNSTKNHIKSLLKQGFSLQDIKNVILWKYEQWGKNPYKFSNGQMSDTYLRPDTLFGNKFESYLVESKRNIKLVSDGPKDITVDLSGKVLEEY